MVYSSTTWSAELPARLKSDFANEMIFRSIYSLRRILSRGRKIVYCRWIHSNVGQTLVVLFFFLHQCGRRTRRRWEDTLDNTSLFAQGSCLKLQHTRTSRTLLPMVTNGPTYVGKKSLGSSFFLEVVPRITFYSQMLVLLVAWRGGCLEEEGRDVLVGFRRSPRPLKSRDCCLRVRRRRYH